MLRSAACVLLAAVGLAACGDDAADGAPREGLSGTMAVLAATSLTDAFEEIAAVFEAEHAGVDVALTFDGSARLANAIVQGAPADVFASADAENLAKVADAGLLDGTGTSFATNELQIVVAAGNPLGIRGLEDLAGDLVLSLCAVEVPCGSYAVAAFDRAGLPAPPSGEEENARAVLSRVQLGEADAGVVYVTDVRAADGVDGVDLAAGEQVVASYRAGVLADTENGEVAAAFVSFLTGPEAQAILSAFGFGPS